MQISTPPSFITLDVDIVSEEDLTPLANYFEEPAFVLGNQKVDNLYYLGLEPCWFSEEDRTPEHCAKFFIQMISGLPEELAGLWSRAKSKTFDFGFESGDSQPYYRSEISQETLAKIVNVGASFTITIYQQCPSEEQSSETASDI
jgi:hypothetical protein